MASDIPGMSVAQERPDEHAAEGCSPSGKGYCIYMNRTEALAAALHASADHKKASTSRDVVTARSAAAMQLDAEHIYAVVVASGEDRTISDLDVLAGLLAAVVKREVDLAVAQVKADLEQDYQARLNGFEAAIARTVSNWRRPTK